MRKIFLKCLHYFWLGAFVLVALGVQFNLFKGIDLQVYNFSQLFYSQTMTTFMKFITFFGSALGIVIGLIIALFFVKNNYGRVLLLVMMGVEVVSNLVLKNLFQRNRPDFPHLVMESSYSFPSGHAMGSTVFYGMILLLIWHSGLSSSLKLILIILGSLLVLLIGFSRIYLGVHYFSDVLGGILFSLFLLSYGKSLLCS